MRFVCDTFKIGHEQDSSDFHAFSNPLKMDFHVLAERKDHHRWNLTHIIFWLVVWNIFDFPIYWE